jgi:hypothetical protein
MRDRGVVSVFYTWILTFSTSFVEEAAFSPAYGFGAFVKTQMAVPMWVYFRVCYSVPVVFMSVFVQVPSCFCYYWLCSII